GDLDAAEEMFKRAIAADPSNVNNLSRYAAFLVVHRGDFDAAEEQFKRAIAADPNHADSLGNYAALLRMHRGDHDAAEEMFKRAIAADPNHANNLGNYALLALRRGDRHAALSRIEAALEAAGNDPTLAPLCLEVRFYQWCAANDAEGRARARAETLRL